MGVGRASNTNLKKILDILRGEGLDMTPQSDCNFCGEGIRVLVVTAQLT